MAGTGETHLKLSVLQRSTVVQGGTPSVYAIPMEQTARDEDGHLEKLEFGTSIQSNANKVIMMVGETGSGKTTLINGLVNYILGVDWDDKFRFKMIVEDSNANQAVSQTKDVTSYTLHHQDGFRTPYSLTIIDTPGFGDTKGIKRDKEIVEQLRKFFTTPGDAGISHIDAIGFVVQASQARLSVGQKYVFDSILALFGRDISDNIFLLVTFADGQEPEVLSAVREAEIPYKEYFQFNNSALYTQTGKNQRFASLFWEMGCESFQILLDKLLHVESKSLVLTKDVLQERKSIEVYIEGIQNEIKVGLSKLNTLEEEKKLLKEHELEIDLNKNFTVVVEEDVFEKKSSDGIFKFRGMRNCLKCERTCCQNCVAHTLGLGDLGCYAMSNSAAHSLESVFGAVFGFPPTSMNKSSMCLVCPSHCPSEEHQICDYMFYVTRKKSVKTVDEIRERYEKARGKKLTAENLIDEIQAEYEEGQEKILQMADCVRKSLERLREIALRPDPLSTVEYIDMMIKNEERTAKAGWQERVSQLNQIRQMAEQVKDIETGNF
uniref:Septin-type G domain-containing protein n=1 Tax=Scylla olivacea TaxID=85551 RepID=A0A0P4VX20_SCYOL